MWSLAQSNCTTPTGTSYPRRPGPCSVAAVHPRKSPSATEPTQRSASKPRHKRYLTQLKPQIPALRRYLQEPSECPPQRWTLLSLTESFPASILPTLKRQKAQVRRSNSLAGRRYGLALRLNTKALARICMIVIVLPTIRRTRRSWRLLRVSGRRPASSGPRRWYAPAELQLLS